MSRTMFLAALAMLTAAQVFGQTNAMEMPKVPDNKMGGFRVGATYVTAFDNKAGRELKTVMEKERVGTIISQFGWHFEHQFLTGTSRNGAVTELLLLAGGMDQGTCIPSASWLIGFRLDNGFELGGGPNLSLTKNLDGELRVSPAFAWGTGYAFRAGALVMPLNVALLQTRGSLRTTMLTGFVF
jgi:hypothetical protein